MKKSTILVVYLMCIVFANAQTDTAYQRSIEDWTKKREQALLAPNGWVNLAGLFWLHPGENRFGNFAAADIAYTAADFPREAGLFTVTPKNEVYWTTAPGVTVTLNDKPVQKALVFHPDSLRSPTLALLHYRFTVIKREDKIGIRFRDLESENVKHFPGIERFPTDKQWKLEATLEPGIGKQIAITNVLGQTYLQPSPGKIVFRVGGKTYKLDAIDEGGDELFIIFGDETSAVSTYPAGRFLYIPKPGADGRVEIDFNKAFNPPCAFTDFATCPLPPKQNFLALAITAGEKNFGKH
jgi:uncharacterized protein